MGDRGQELLTLAAELEQRDARVAAELVAIGDLAQRISVLRARAAEIDVTLRSLPEDRDAADRAVQEAHSAERAARDELRAAEAKLQDVEGRRRTSEEENARARSEAKVAQETLADAEHRVARLTAHRVELDEVESALRAEAEGLVVQAQPLAAALRATPRMVDAAKGEPGTALAELEDWAARARAALFVARGTLETERERIVAEANALGAAVTGEAAAGTSVALVRKRIEDALA
jgi:chromosome segregation ATPase